MSNPKKLPYIRINHVKVYLDLDDLREGTFTVAEGCLSEQCEDCGEPIDETGVLYGDDPKDASVLCDGLNGGCESFYTVEND